MPLSWHVPRFNVPSSLSELLSHLSTFSSQLILLAGDHGDRWEAGHFCVEGRYPRVAPIERFVGQVDIVEELAQPGWEL